MSTATQLTSVRAAIAAIEGGAQSFSIDGISYSYANLSTLYERERELLRRQTSGNVRKRTAPDFSD